jgi:hypothetical protein
MSIANAVIRGTQFFIYDEKGRQLGSGASQGGQIVGFTATTVSIKRGNMVYIYNEKGQVTSSTRA